MTEVLLVDTFGKITSQCFLRLILGTIDYNNYDNLTYTIYFVRRFVILYANVATTSVTTFVRLNVLYPLKSQTDCVQHSTVDIALRVCAIEAIESPTPTKLRPRKQAPSDTAELARRKLQRHRRVGAFIQVRSQCAVHATAVSVFAK